MIQIADLSVSFTIFFGMFPMIFFICHYYWLITISIKVIAQNITVLPQSQPKNNDVVDLLLEAAMTMDESPDEQGIPRHHQIVNSKQVWYETRMVNSPTFARFALRKEQWQNLAIQAANFMCKERADIIANQIILHDSAYGYSIDAKGSETLRDKHNSQANLIQTVHKNHASRAITVEDKVKNGFMSGMMGKKSQEDAMYD